jgi:hypothetical protein
VTAVINSQGQPIGNTFNDQTQDESDAGVTVVNPGYDELDPHRYSNTLDHNAVQLAVNVAAQKTGGGRVPIREDFIFTSPVEIALNVFVEWWGGSITINGCGAFEFNFVTGVGQHGIIGALPINGINCETVIAIDQFTQDDTRECYGIVIDGPQIRNVNKCIRLRTARNFRIENVWGEHCNSGVDLAGHNFVCRFNNNEFVSGIGCGAGASDGLLLDFATFTNGGSHLVRPEGIYGDGVQLYGFLTALNASAAVSVILTSVDLNGAINTVKVSSVDGIFSLQGYFEIVGASAVASINLIAQASVVVGSSIKLTGTCVAVSTTSCKGLLIGDNQTGVDVELDFVGFPSYDIHSANAGNINIRRGTKCRSTTLATSIRIESGLSARPITIEDGVYCAGRVDVPFSSPSKGQVLIGALSGAYSTYVRGVSTITNPATSVTTTLESLLGSSTQTGNTNGTNGVISALADTAPYDLGSKVFVSNGFATTGPFRLLSKTASTITVDATSDTSETGINVSLRNIPNFAASADTDMVPELFLGAPSADVDGVFGSAAVDGVTINVNTTPAASVTIPWEVRVRQRYS